jgi:hypothetical protein
MPEKLVSREVLQKSLDAMREIWESHLWIPAESGVNLLRAIMAAEKELEETK